MTAAPRSLHVAIKESQFFARCRRLAIALKRTKAVVLSVACSFRAKRCGGLIFALLQNRFAPCKETSLQVEALQEGIGRLRSDIKEAKGRGEEKERQQRDQLTYMEKTLTVSEREADAAEKKLELMESVISKLKVGTEELYAEAKYESKQYILHIWAQLTSVFRVGSTPVLSLLGSGDDAAGVAAAAVPDSTPSAAASTEQSSEEAAEGALLPATAPARPLVVTENNVIMYLDMVHEKIVELKTVAQFLDSKRGLTIGGMGMPPLSGRSPASPLSPATAGPPGLAAAAAGKQALLKGQIVAPDQVGHLIYLWVGIEDQI